MNDMHDTHRRLSDGVTISTGGSGVEGWVSVRVMTFEGILIYNGCIPAAEAFTEIPFMLDRARAFQKAYQDSQEKGHRNEAF